VTCFLVFLILVLLAVVFRDKLFVYPCCK